MLPESGGRVTESRRGQQTMPDVQGGVRENAPVRGSTCGALRDAPSSVPAQPSRQPLGAPPAPKFADARPQGGGRTPPRRACALARPGAVPPPGVNATRSLARAEERRTRPPLRRPPRWAGPAPPDAGWGRAGRPPPGDVRPVSRRVAVETAIPFLRVSGGHPLPFSFFLNGRRGRRRADSAPCGLRRPCPRRASVYLCFTWPGRQPL